MLTYYLVEEINIPIYRQITGQYQQANLSGTDYKGHGRRLLVGVVTLCVPGISLGSAHKGPCLNQWVRVG